MASIGPLLPRDFLERQPKRWQKSQRKRGAQKVLKRMQIKREKLEQTAVKHLASDRVWAKEQQKLSSATPTEPWASPEEDATDPVVGSRCTPFKVCRRGFWAAALAPNQPLVVRIPKGTRLCLMHATLAPSDSATDSLTALRCRVPSNELVTTLCMLGGTGATGSRQLQVAFSHADGKCALAAEGLSTVHVLGCYRRSGDFSRMVAPSVAVVPASVVHPTPRTFETHAAPQDSGGRIVPAAKPSAAAPPPAVASVPATPGLQELAGGLKVVDVSVGQGKPAKKGDRLTMRYTGLTADSQGSWYTFDDNRGKRFTFVLGEGIVIPGWEAGLPGMRLGGVRRLIVPPSLGYGAGGAGSIPADATLVFEVTLLNLQWKAV